MTRAPTPRLLLITLLGATLSACGLESESNLQSYVVQTKARQKVSIPPLPKPETFEIFTYQQASLRDPFVPSEVIAAAQRRTDDGGLRPDLERKRDPLEEFKLGSLKMMGSLEKEGQRWALIRTADGTLHRTTKGHYIGQSNGQIVSIGESQIELREIVPDGLGSWIEKFTTLSTQE